MLEIVLLSSQAYTPSDTHCSFHIKSYTGENKDDTSWSVFSFFLPSTFYLMYTIFLCSASKNHTDWEVAREKAAFHYLPVTKDAH